jgi:hypothetical protein
VTADTAHLRLTVDTAARRLMVAASKTGINAHYHFAGVPCGPVCPLAPLQRFQRKARVCLSRTARFCE